MKDQQQLIAKMKAISSIAKKPQFEDSESESSIARKAVPLQDLELWPDEIVCFTAWTNSFSRQEPETRTYVSESRLDEMRRLNDCYRIRRDALAEENAKLRGLVKAQMQLNDAVYKYLASEPDEDRFNAMLNASNKVGRLLSELWIEVD